MLDINYEFRVEEQNAATFNLFQVRIDTKVRRAPSLELTEIILLTRAALEIPFLIHISRPRFNLYSICPMIFGKFYYPFACTSRQGARRLRREESTAGVLGTANETRSASQKIKHLYSAEIFQRRLDSFLISFMAGRNITPDLLPPTTATITIVTLARAHHSRGSRFNFSPLLSSRLITNARRVRVGGTSSGVRPTSVSSAVQTRDVLGIPRKSPGTRREVFDCKSPNFRPTFPRSRAVNRYSGVTDHVGSKYRASYRWYRLFNKIDSRDCMIGQRWHSRVKSQYIYYTCVCVYIHI